MANVEKLERVLDHIRMNRDQHDQRYWGIQTECGTTMCFAGWAVALEGYKINWRRHNEPTLRGVDTHAASCKVPGGVVMSHIGNAAEGLLELTCDQATALFYKAETFDDVERTVKDIINAEGVD